MQYQTLLDAMTLDRDQQAIAQMLYSEYASTIDAAVAQADADAAAAGRDTVDQVLAGKVRATSDELRRMRGDVVKAYTTVWSAADDALENLLNNTAAVLTDVQLAELAPRLRDLRRAVILEPTRDTRFNSEYAGEGVSVLELASEAQAEGGELVSVDRAQLAGLLQQYELALDEILTSEADVMRSAPVEKRIASIQRDPTAERNAQAKMLEPWQRMYQLNRRTVLSIADLLPNPAARHRWMDRFDRACFPWLLEDDRIDRQYEWMSKQSLDGETWSKVQTAYATFTKQRRVLAQQMIEMIVRARLTHHVALHPMMDPTAVPAEASGMYEDMIKLTGQQKAAATTMSDVITSSLNDAQRKAMSRALR